MKCKKMVRAFCKKYVQEGFLGEESLGKKYMGEKYVQQESLVENYIYIG